MTELALLAGLAASAFLSATVLPGNSELALSALFYQQPALLWPAVLVASVANTSGSATSVWLGRRAPAKALPARTAGWFARFGPAALFLSWVPLLGDALPLAAGWLRLPWWPCLLWLAAGKTLRYLLLAWGLQQWL
ncbi:MAG: YqaA family protein [Vogesella sp.]|uniref:YqaA family protein n=1 Tax=Vogesella sp. TaxID=1904252 RepID=UPI003F2AF381